MSSIGNIPTTPSIPVPNISLEQVHPFSSGSPDPLAPHILTPEDEQALNELLREESRNCNGSSSQVLTALFKAHYVYAAALQDIAKSKQIYDELLSDVNKQTEEVEALKTKIETYDSVRGKGKSVAESIVNISLPAIVFVPYVVGAIGTTIAVGCRLVAEATAAVLTPRSSSTSSLLSTPPLPSESPPNTNSSYKEIEWYQVLSEHMKDHPGEKISRCIKGIIVAIDANDTTIVPAYRDVIGKISEIKIANAIRMGEFWKELDEKGLLNTFVEITGELRSRIPDVGSALGKRKRDQTTSSESDAL